MLKPYHRQICQRALADLFSPTALAVIIATNLAQDGLRGQIGHPEFHFDDSAFEASAAYLADQRQVALAALQAGTALPAWQAFGRLTHAAQDFYAHSNYLSLWAALHAQAGLPPATQVEALSPEILQHPGLRSGKVYFWDWLAFVPGLGGLVERLLPADSHAHMNLDHPGRGLLFPYVIEAAVKRTRGEYDLLAGRIRRDLDDRAVARFRDG